MNAKSEVKTSAIQTTGDLRQFLADMLLGIKNGDLAIDKASQITKMAGQINESFYSEVKVWRVRKEAGDTDTKLGELPLKQNAANP
jgi:hypothetical protein